MRRHAWPWAVLLAMTGLLWGCGGGKGAAERAFAEVESAFARIAVEAGHLAPDETDRLADEIAATRARLTERDYTGVLAACPALESRIAALAESLPGRREQLQVLWDELAGTVPGAVAALDKKLRDFGRPPAGMPGRAEFDRASARLEDLRQRWADALELVRQQELAKGITAADAIRVEAVRVLTEFNQSGS